MLSRFKRFVFSFFCRRHDWVLVDSGMDWSLEECSRCGLCRYWIHGDEFGPPNPDVKAEAERLKKAADRVRRVLGMNEDE